jgi:P-type conjugative transfer protein TrbJ
VKKVVASFLLGCALWLGLPQPSAAQIPVTDVAHIVQTIFHYIGRLYEIEQKAESLYRQYEQYKAQLQALKKLEHPNFRRIQRVLANIEVTLEQFDHLVYTLDSIDRDFQETFPGMVEAPNHRETVFQRSRRMLDAARAVLNATHNQGKSIHTAIQTLDLLKDQVAEVRGHEEALELSTTVGTFSAEELLLVRQSLASTNNLLAITIANQEQREAEAQTNFESLLLRTAFPAGRSTPSTFTPIPDWWPY